MDSELSHEGETEIMLGQKSAFPETSESLGFLASPFLSHQVDNESQTAIFFHSQQKYSGGAGGGGGGRGDEGGGGDGGGDGRGYGSGGRCGCSKGGGGCDGGKIVIEMPILELQISQIKQYMVLHIASFTLHMICDSLFMILDMLVICSF